MLSVKKEPWVRGRRRARYVSLHPFQTHFRLVFFFFFFFFPRCLPSLLGVTLTLTYMCDNIRSLSKALPSSEGAKYCSTSRARSTKTTRCYFLKYFNSPTDGKDRDYTLPAFLKLGGIIAQQNLYIYISRDSFSKLAYLSLLVSDFFPP